MHIVNLLRRHFVCLLTCVLVLVTKAIAVGEVIWAVNCGGDAHTDIHGIRYQRDPLQEGIVSDYGKNLHIQRVPAQDQILYQTERYHVSTFGYEVPIKQDGDYLVVLKFSEVWFTSPNKKVFDVVLNGEHTVVQSLDIFDKVGRGAAHDEIIPFSVKGTKLKFNGELSVVKGNKVAIQFVKGDYDNPKINALYVMKGVVDDVPRLPPLPGMAEKGRARDSSPQTREEDPEEEDELEESVEPKKAKKHHRPSSPKVQDPYAADDTGSMLLPMFVAIGAFIPLLFCLCKL